MKCISAKLEAEKNQISDTLKSSNAILESKMQQLKDLGQQHDALSCKNREFQLTIESLNSELSKSRELLAFNAEQWKENKSVLLTDQAAKYAGKISSLTVELSEDLAKQKEVLISKIALASERQVKLEAELVNATEHFHGLLSASSQDVASLQIDVSLTLYTVFCTYYLA